MQLAWWFYQTNGRLRIWGSVQCRIILYWIQLYIVLQSMWWYLVGKQKKITIRAFSVSHTEHRKPRHNVHSKARVSVLKSVPLLSLLKHWKTIDTNSKVPTNQLHYNICHVHIRSFKPNIFILKGKKKVFFYQISEILIPKNHHQGNTTSKWMKTLISKIK